MSPITFSFSDHAFVVVGAASGIGEAVARNLSEAGASVILADINVESGTRLEKALDSAIFVRTDVAEPDSVAALFETVLDKHRDGIDGLVNTAAWIYPEMYRPIQDVALEEWDKADRVNLRGAMLTCKLALPLLSARKGSVVNITSVGARVVFANGAAYCTSKAGLEHFTRCLAFEVASMGIRVNAIAPGYIDTPGVSFATQDAEATQQVIDAKIPLGRLGRPGEVADATLFLLSHLASYVTGSTLLVDGGWSLT